LFILWNLKKNIIYFLGKRTSFEGQKLLEFFYNTGLAESNLEYLMSIIKNPQFDPGKIFNLMIKKFNIYFIANLEKNLTDLQKNEVQDYPFLVHLYIFNMVSY
jgi:hypothetical protein